MEANHLSSYSFDRDWEYRMKVAKRFIPEDSKVLDLGAGTERLLKHIIPRKYVPMDCFRVTNNTIVADFNTELPDIEGKYNIVCLGILEYMDDAKQFLSKIEKYGNHLVLSYYQYHTKMNMWNNNYGYIDIINFINQTNWKIKWIEPIKETGELLFICEK